MKIRGYLKMENMLQVGVISSTHGIRGEVKVFPTTDDAGRFKKLKEVIVDTGKEALIFEIEGVKFFKQFVILKLSYLLSYFSLAFLSYFVSHLNSES